MVGISFSFIDASKFEFCLFKSVNGKVNSIIKCLLAVIVLDVSELHTKYELLLPSHVIFRVSSKKSKLSVGKYTLIVLRGLVSWC